MVGGHSDGAAVARKGLRLVAVCEEFRALGDLSIASEGVYDTHCCGIHRLQQARK